MASGGNKTIEVLVDLEKGILIPEITYDYGELIFTNAPENYINEYLNKKIKVTYDGTEYELTVKSVNINDSNFYYVGGEPPINFDSNIDFTNYPFHISWFYQDQWYGNINFETGGFSHIIKVEAIKEEPTPTPAPTKPKKKNLLTVLKKLFTNLSGQEPEGKNLVEVIDNAAENVQSGGNGSSGSGNGAETFVCYCDPSEFSYAAPYVYKNAERTLYEGTELNDIRSAIENADSIKIIAPYYDGEGSIFYPIDYGIYTDDNEGSFYIWFDIIFDDEGQLTGKRLYVLKISGK